MDGHVIIIIAKKIYTTGAHASFHYEYVKWHICLNIYNNDAHSWQRRDETNTYCAFWFDVTKIWVALLSQ